MWVHTDQAAGQNFDRLELSATIGVACAIAFVAGIAIDFAILATLAGEGGIVILFDVVVVPFWTLTLLLAGSVLSQIALRTGWFGLTTWTLGSILAVATVTTLVAWMEGGIHFWSVHQGLLFGGLAGFLVWFRVVSRRPKLLSPSMTESERLRKRGVTVSAALLAVWLLVLSITVSRSFA